MVLRLSRLAVGVCLAGLFYLTACSSTRSPTAIVKTEAFATIETVSPDSTSEVAQGRGSETSYPGLVTEVSQINGSETAYPVPTIVQGGEVSDAYPAPGAYPSPAQANTVQSSSGQDAYPAPGTVGQYQQPAYPAPGTVGQYPQPAYPAPGTTGQNQQPASPSDYPAPEAEVQQPPTPLNTPYPAPAGETPTASQPDATAPTRTSQTPTPLIPVPTVTITPMVSLTAIPTGTPVPTPTEVDPNFHPTDPTTVRLASGKVQLVEFFTYWCGECRAMAPLVHSLEAQYQDRMNFIYLDTDNPATMELKKDLGYRDQPDNPQFFLLDASGKILRKWVGAVTAEEFKDSFDAALK